MLRVPVEFEVPGSFTTRVIDANMTGSHLCQIVDIVRISLFPISRSWFYQYPCSVWLTSWHSLVVSWKRCSSVIWDSRNWYIVIRLELLSGPANENSSRSLSVLMELVEHYSSGGGKYNIFAVNSAEVHYDSKGVKFRKSNYSTICTIIKYISTTFDDTKNWYLKARLAIPLVFLISIEVKYTLNEVMIEHVWLAG